MAHDFLMFINGWEGKYSFGKESTVGILLNMRILVWTEKINGRKSKIMRMVIREEKKKTKKNKRMDFIYGKRGHTC